MRRSRTRRAQQQPRRVKFLVGYWLLGALCTAKPEPTPTLRAVELSIQALCVCGCGFSASFLSRPGAVVSNIRQRLRKWSTLDLAKCSPSRHHFSAPAKWQNLEPGLQAGRSCPAPQVRSPPARGGCSADAVETARLPRPHSRLCIGVGGHARPTLQFAHFRCSSPDVSCHRGSSQPDVEAAPSFPLRLIRWGTSLQVSRCPVTIPT